MNGSKTGDLSPYERNPPRDELKKSSGTRGLVAPTVRLCTRECSGGVIGGEKVEVRWQQTVLQERLVGSTPT